MSQVKKKLNLEDIQRGLNDVKRRVLELEKEEIAVGFGLLIFGAVIGLAIGKTLSSRNKD